MATKMIWKTHIFQRVTGLQRSFAVNCWREPGQILNGNGTVSSVIIVRRRIALKMYRTLMLRINQPKKS